MIMYSQYAPVAARAATGRLSLLPLSLALLLGGCEGLTDVDASTKTVPAEQLNNPTSLDARLIGAEADFFFAYDMAIVYGGLFTDELIDATGFTAVDERRVTADNGAVGSVDEAPEGIDGLWTPLQRAVAVSDLLQEDLLAGTYSDRIPNAEGSPQLARVSLFNGYAKMMLGDLFCTTAFGGTGPEYTSQETYALAEDEFTLAIAAANAESEVRNAALVGRARARLQMGDEAGALADAQQVPADFEYIADVYSTNSSREENDLWNVLFDSDRFSVGPEFRDLAVGYVFSSAPGSPYTSSTLPVGEPDPRVVVRLEPGNGVGADGSTPQYEALKYGSATAPIRLASGIQAQYIIAEIQGGQQAVDIINAIRERYGIEENFASSDPEEIRRTLEEERSRTLFLEGQRMGDLRRYLEKYGWNLFPTGENYGDQTCLPLPNAERNNNPGLNS